MGDLRTTFVPNLPFGREEACQVMQRVHLPKGRAGNETWPGNSPNGFKSKLFLMEAFYVCWVHRWSLLKAQGLLHFNILININIYASWKFHLKASNTSQALRPKGKPGNCDFSLRNHFAESAFSIPLEKTVSHQTIYLLIKITRH